MRPISPLVLISYNFFHIYGGILEGSLNLDDGGIVFIFLIIVTVGSCMMMIDEYLKDARSDHLLFLSATH